MDKMNKGVEKSISISANISMSSVLLIIMAKTARNENGRERRRSAQNFIVPLKKSSICSFVANSYSFTNTLSDKILLIFNFEFLKISSFD